MQTDKEAKNDLSVVEPDAWARFERAVDVVAKAPPQHRTKPTERKRKRKSITSPKQRKAVKKSAR